MGGSRAYTGVTSSIHPKKEDHDALASQNRVQNSLSSSFQYEETEDDSSQESEDGQATEDYTPNVVEVSDKAQDYHKCLKKEEEVNYGCASNKFLQV